LNALGHTDGGEKIEVCGLEANAAPLFDGAGPFAG
jgi:hypothetical protein